MTPMFGASSRQISRNNRDGSNSVYCFSCGEFISVTFERIQRAQCELCRRIENGEDISEEMIRQYKLAKADRVDNIGALNLPEPSTAAVGLKKKFSFASIAGEVTRALGNFKLAGKDKQPVEATPSAQVAKAKRRPRLFSDGSLGKLGKK